jgi:antitoxin component of RelBE/YafQ-DinJ toxin-antitoxin module
VARTWYDWGVAKENVIRLRVDDAEKARFEELAEEEGRSLSSWMRYHLLRIARQNSPPSSKKKKLKTHA